MKVYEGIRTNQGCTVTVNGQPLELRHDLYNHSPTGAEWGYGGSGPAQLALDLLTDALGDDELAQQYYQEFKRDIVVSFAHERWFVTQAEIRSWIAQVLAGRQNDEEEDKMPF